MFGRHSFLHPLSLDQITLQENIFWDCWRCEADMPFAWTGQEVPSHYPKKCLHAVWFIRDGFIRDAFQRLLDLLEKLRDEV